MSRAERAVMSPRTETTDLETWLDIKREIARLEGMATKELVAEFTERWGYQSHSHNRKWLIRRIAWRIQEQAHGGLSERAKARIQELAANAVVRLNPPKDWPPTAPTSPTQATSREINQTREPGALLPGTRLVRRYRGRVHEVVVLDGGEFEYGGEVYRSLTAVARAITGQHLSGPRFFKIKESGKP